MICKICNREFDKDKGLSQHIRHSHKMTAKEYYLKYIDSNGGKCCCCGKPTPFYSIREGFQRHCSTECANTDEESIAKSNETKRSFSDEKRADIRRRTNRTCDELYGGVGFASEELREKARQTNELVNGSRTYNNREKCEQTWIDRTGYKSNLCIPENQELFKRIKFEKYGDKNYNNREKCSETNMNLYGNVCPANSVEGHAKAIQTMIENSGSIEQSYANRMEKSKQTKQLRYGDEDYHNVKQMKITIANMSKEQKEEISDKRRDTCNDKYGVDSYSKTDEFKLKYVTTCEERYGYKYPFAQGKFKQNYSKGEKEVALFVQSIYDGLILEGDRKVLKPTEENGWKACHELDVYIPDLSLAIEYNGDYYHDYNKFPEKKILDEQKQKECVQLGIHLLTIWEHDWKNNEKEVKKLITEEIERLRNDKRNEKVVSDNII